MRNLRIFVVGVCLAAATVSCGAPESAFSINETVFADSVGCQIAKEIYELPFIESPQPAEDLASRLKESEELITKISQTEVGDVDRIEILVELEGSTAEVLQREWGATGAEVVEQAKLRGWSASSYALQGEVFVVDGDEWSGGNYLDLRVEVLHDIYVECIEPSGMPPFPETVKRENFPEVSLFAQTIEQPATPARFDFGDDNIEPEPYGHIIHSISSDETTGLALDSDGYVLLVDMASGETETLNWAGEGWSCLAWTQDMTAILGTRLMIDGAIRNDLSVATLSTEEVTTQPSPTADYCPLDAGTDTVVFVSEFEIMATRLGEGFGQERTTLWAEDTCSFGVNEDIPADGVVLVNANCSNPYVSGLYSFDLETGEKKHLLAGQVGAGSISSDGKFLAFSYQQLGSLDTEYDLYLATLDVQEIWDTGQQYSFPMFASQDDTA